MEDLGIIDKGADVSFKQPIVTKEAIVGATNDLMPIHFILEGSKVQKSITRIVVKGKHKGRIAKWHGTGFMISDDLLLTNHHVLPSKDVIIEAVAQFNFQSDWNGVLQQVKNYDCNFDVFYANQDLDFAIVKINNKPGKEFDKVVMDYTTEVFEQEPVYIIQHPQGREKEIAFRNNIVKRIKQDDRDSFPGTIVHYTTDTEPGSSGSPVFTGAWDLVGLHHASIGYGNRIVNEGIRLKAIIEHLLEKFNTFPIDLQNYLRAALIDANLTKEQKHAINLKQFVKKRFFGSLGLQTKIDDYGLEKVVITTKGSEFFDLASWNIRWFGSTRNAPIDRITNVGDYMHALGMDLWGLVEVAEPAMKGIKTIFEKNYNLDYKYTLGESTNQQFPAIFYDAEKIECQKRDDDGFFDVKWKNKDLFPRKPLWAYVTAKGENDAVFDFNLIVLHLKAMSDKNSVEQRIEEIKLLRKWIDERLKKDNDKDYVIVGDWNDEIDSKPFEGLRNEEQYLNILTQKDAESGNKDAISYISSPKSLIDHIVISNDAFEEYKNDSIEIVRSDKIIDKYVGRDSSKIYSDHVPVVARFVYQKVN